MDKKSMMKKRHVQKWDNKFNSIASHSSQRYGNDVDALESESSDEENIDIFFW